jgi:hypothetical protein
MGAGFLQDLNNQGATQNAQQFNMPRSQGGGYTTTQGENFNYTTPNAPYWGTYVNPIDVSPTTQTQPSTPVNNYRGGGGQVYYDPQRDQYYTQNSNFMGNFFTGGANRNYIGSSPKGKKSSEDSFDNQTKLPSYSSYIPPEQMPNINAYLADPNSLLGAMQDAEMPMSGAGRYTNLLSTTKSS